MSDYRPKPGTLPARVIAVLQRHPEQALSSADIVQKFSDESNKLTPSGVDASLLAALNAGVLKRSTNGYRLGATALPTQATMPTPVWPSARVEHSAKKTNASSAGRIEWAKLTPVAGVPIPAKRTRGASSDLMEFVRTMEVGTCTPSIDRRSCMQSYQSVTKAAKRATAPEWLIGREFSYRAEGDGTARFWRVK